MKRRVAATKMDGIAMAQQLGAALEQEVLVLAVISIITIKHPQPYQPQAECIQA